jgi:hypothetical protein
VLRIVVEAGQLLHPAFEIREQHRRGSTSGAFPARAIAMSRLSVHLWRVGFVGEDRYRFSFA